VADDAVSGPVEIAVIAFPGSQFKGDIVPAIQDLVEKGIIRVIDLVVVRKEQDGTIVTVEVSQLDDTERAAFGALDSDVQLLNDEDLELAAEALEPGTTAGVIVWEDVWAIPTIKAIREAGGILVARDLIDAETVDEVRAALAEISE